MEKDIAEIIRKYEETISCLRESNTPIYYCWDNCPADWTQYLSITSYILNNVDVNYDLFFITDSENRETPQLMGKMVCDALLYGAGDNMMYAYFHDDVTEEEFLKYTIEKMKSFAELDEIELGDIGAVYDKDLAATTLDFNGNLLICQRLDQSQDFDDNEDMDGINCHHMYHIPHNEVKNYKHHKHTGRVSTFIDY